MQQPTDLPRGLLQTASDCHNRLSFLDLHRFNPLYGLCAVKDGWRFMAATYWALERVLMVLCGMLAQLSPRFLPEPQEQVFGLVNRMDSAGQFWAREDRQDGGVCKISGTRFPFCYHRPMTTDPVLIGISRGGLYAYRCAQFTSVGSTSNR